MRLSVSCPPENFLVRWGKVDARNDAKRNRLFTDPPILPESVPCVVVIFGASGDLTKRKLVPALYDLFAAGCLAKEFAVLGVGRDQLSTEQFRQSVREGTASSKDVDTFTDEKWDAFAAR